ncbi:ribosomal-protein-alanine acetyltransferase [Microbacteriaceae bacterium MWH-Ta3]|nr:ribosomal-protein-alanine acetyltransferase [Microbacteriaceae bacterium MWH-Ta3]
MIQIRRANTQDFDAIYALELATFPEDSWSRAAITAELASPYGRYLVAEDGDTLVGYAGAQLLPGATQGDIQTIAVAAAYRGQHIGARLLDTLLDYTESQGATEMMLEVRADNPVAQALYESRGFTVIAVRERYYQPSDIDALIMQRVRARD